MSLFKRAVKEQAKLRLAIDGPSGSGKTYSALAIASFLGEKIAVIDTEHGSASKYADYFSFDVLPLDNFSPDKYIEAIKAAEKEHYDVLIIDSLSHAWFGVGGILDIHTAKEKQQKNPNSWTAWKDVTPLQNKLVECILSSGLHVIATLRVKTKHEQVEENGKKVIRKLGAEPIQKDNIEYEFDVYGSMSLDHELVIFKTRCSELTDQVFPKPGKEFASILNNWLTSGEKRTPEKPQEVVSKPEMNSDTSEAWKRFKEAYESIGMTQISAKMYLLSKNVNSDDYNTLSPSDIDSLAKMLVDDKASEDLFKEEPV